MSSDSEYSDDAGYSDDDFESVPRGKDRGAEGNQSQGQSDNKAKPAGSAAGGVRPSPKDGSGGDEPSYSDDEFADSSPSPAREKKESQPVPSSSAAPPQKPVQPAPSPNTNSNRPAPPPGVKQKPSGPSTATKGNAAATSNQNSTSTTTAKGSSGRPAPPQDSADPKTKPPAPSAAPPAEPKEKERTNSKPAEASPSRNSPATSRSSSRYSEDTSDSSPSRRRRRSSTRRRSSAKDNGSDKEQSDPAPTAGKASGEGTGNTQSHSDGGKKSEAKSGGDAKKKRDGKGQSRKDRSQSKRQTKSQLPGGRIGEDVLALNGRGQLAMSAGNFAEANQLFKKAYGLLLQASSSSTEGQGQEGSSADSGAPATSLPKNECELLMSATLNNLGCLHQRIEAKELETGNSTSKGTSTQQSNPKSFQFFEATFRMEQKLGIVSPITLLNLASTCGNATQGRMYAEQGLATLGAGSGLSEERLVAVKTALRARRAQSWLQEFLIKHPNPPSNSTVSPTPTTSSSGRREQSDGDRPEAKEVSNEALAIMEELRRAILGSDEKQAASLRAVFHDARLRLKPYFPKYNGEVGHAQTARTNPLNTQGGRDERATPPSSVANGSEASSARRPRGGGGRARGVGAAGESPERLPSGMSIPRKGTKGIADSYFTSAECAVEKGDAQSKLTKAKDVGRPIPSEHQPILTAPHPPYLPSSLRATESGEGRVVLPNVYETSVYAQPKYKGEDGNLTNIPLPNAKKRRIRPPSPMRRTRPSIAASDRPLSPGQVITASARGPPRRGNGRRGERTGKGETEPELQIPDSDIDDAIDRLLGAN